MDDKRCFVQFPHPGAEPRPDRGCRISWNKTHCNNKCSGHKRKFMQLPGEWIETGGTRRSGDLWAWGEWEPESDLIPEFSTWHRGSHHPRYLWEPYWVPKNSYQDRHNTDPFIFGDRFLYSNCGQVAPGRRGLKHLGQGSVIAFGSGKKADGERKWMLDTVLVVRDSFRYDPLESRRVLECKVPDAFLSVTGRPLATAPCLADNPENDRLRLYRGATPDNPVCGMFSFFPAMPAGRDAGFPRPFISLPGEFFNPGCWQAPKGHGKPRTLNELRGLWCSLVNQVLDAGLVLGICAQVPPRRDG